MMRMMLQHGMLDEDDEQRCKDMIAEHERKQEKFNMTPCDKNKADRQKWSEFLELYEVRLRIEQNLDGRLELLKRTNPKEKGYLIASRKFHQVVRRIIKSSIFKRKFRILR